MRNNPAGAVAGIQNFNDNQIEYQDKLPETCQLSK